MTSPDRTSRPYLMITACAGTFAFGTLVAFLGSTLPELRTKLNFGMEQSGTLFSLLFFPQIAMSVFAGPVIDRFGKKPVLVTGSLLAAVVLALISTASSYGMLAALVFILGLGASCINSGANTLVPDLYPENPSSALNLASASFSLGTVGVPLVITLLAHRFGVGSALLLVAALNAVPGLLSLTQTFPHGLSKGRPELDGHWEGPFESGHHSFGADLSSLLVSRSFHRRLAANILGAGVFGVGAGSRVRFWQSFSR